MPQRVRAWLHALHLRRNFRSWWQQTRAAHNPSVVLLGSYLHIPRIRDAHTTAAVAGYRAVASPGAACQAEASPEVACRAVACRAVA
eukprot:CAMPEP_0185167376 /NCGR_PEP_ID=MMETSP1139-20130426/14159_1 /TAXON_ID=298111 /ORGANISM="Pavlova sp., Strain CCMP459" /LENGTH=86 /DNA_ID=CAMNT_0027732855 /DNA_START=310 /DNA_END=566 /DNA_ORIENTATION=+